MSHGNVNLKLTWEIQPEDLNYDPLLLICFEGLVEQAHPYKFLAYQCSIDLLSASNSSNKIIPLLPKLIRSLRGALNSKYESICLKAVEVTKILSSKVKEKLNPYVKFFIQPINKLSYDM